MKKTLLAVTLFPLLSHAVDMTLDENIRGLPEDFRQYFYNSELNVQVYLNDNRLFDAAVALKEMVKFVCYEQLMRNNLLIQIFVLSGVTYLKRAFQLVNVRKTARQD